MALLDNRPRAPILCVRSREDHDSPPIAVADLHQHPFTDRSALEAAVEAYI
jgi:hypothetical protein